MSFNVGVVAREIPDHYHKISDELYYVHKGQGMMRIGDSHAALKDGDAVVVFAS